VIRPDGNEPAGDAGPCPGTPAKGDITRRLIMDREFVTQLLSGRSGVLRPDRSPGLREDSSPAVLAGAGLSMAGGRLSSINVALVTMAELRQCRRSGRVRTEARPAPHCRPPTSVQVTALRRRQTGISRRIRVRPGQAGERPDLTSEAGLPNVSSCPERVADREGRRVSGIEHPPLTSGS